MNLYEELKYRVDLIEDDNLPDEVAHILKIPNFRKFYTSKRRHPAYKHRVIKYIGMMYDPKSPFPVEYLDLEKRKMAVAYECNFTEWGERGSKFREEYQEFIDVSSELAITLILSFLKDMHYDVWTEIQTTEQELWEYQKLRWEQISTKETKTGKSKKSGEEGETYTYDKDIADKDIFEAAKKKEALLDASKKRREYLKELYEEMYADNVDVKAAVRQIPVSPENILDVLGIE